jgi:hypothetical protein
MSLSHATLPPEHPSYVLRDAPVYDFIPHEAVPYDCSTRGCPLKVVS